MLKLISNVTIDKNLWKINHFYEDHTKPKGFKNRSFKIPFSPTDVSSYERYVLSICNVNHRLKKKLCAKHCQIKLQRLKKARIWAFGLLVH